MSENIEVKDVKIKDLKPFENRFRLHFKVINKSEEREITNRNNEFETHRISDITVADDTGSILLSAWDDDISFLEEGGFFKIENGYVNIYRDSMRLARGKFGNFAPITEEFEIDETSNRSDEVHERQPRRTNYNNQRNNSYGSEGRSQGRNLRF
jgi:replication factor A1